MYNIYIWYIWYVLSCDIHAALEGLFKLKYLNPFETHFICRAVRLDQVIWSGKSLPRTGPKNKDRKSVPQTGSDQLRTGGPEIPVNAGVSYVRLEWLVKSGWYYMSMSRSETLCLTVILNKFRVLRTSNSKNRTFNPAQCSTLFQPSQISPKIFPNFHYAIPQ